MFASEAFSSEVAPGSREECAFKQKTGAPLHRIGKGSRKSYVLAFAIVLSAPVSAQSAGPFSAFAGNFRGGGEVIGSDGHKERLSCRVVATVDGGGDSLTQNIVCASDSYRLDIHGHAVAQGGSVSGDWQESTRGVSGALSGRVSDGHFSGSVSGGSFNAGVSLRVSGRRMSFDLRPRGGDVARVDVSVSR